MSALGAWIRIAARNIVKNLRRSLFTIAAIAFGFAAVNVFHGFTNYIYQSLEDAYIHLRAQGHVTIFKEGFREHGSLDPVRYLITADEAAVIREIVLADPRVRVLTPQLAINGLASNGEVSTIFVAAGRVAEDVRVIRSFASVRHDVQLFDGVPLDDEVQYGVSVSAGLARLLGLEIGSEALIVMAPTVHGTMNALDGKVMQTFASPSEALDDKMMVVTLDYAQSLYDTASVDRFTILLEDTQHTDSVAAALDAAFRARELGMEVKPWLELATFYTKTKKMFDIIFLFIFIIVSLIVVMSIVNTIGMAVMERTREFGTLRALGLKRAGVIRLVALESGLLTVLGSVIGLVITLAAWAMVTLAAPTWTPPQLSKEIPLELDLAAAVMVGSFVFLTALGVLVSVLPARRAARQSIVDALGHV